MVLSEDNLSFYIRILNVFVFGSSKSTLLVPGNIAVNMVSSHIAYKRLGRQTKTKINNHNTFCYKAIRNAKKDQNLDKKEIKEELGRGKYLKVLNAFT